MPPKKKTQKDQGHQKKNQGRHHKRKPGNQKPWQRQIVDGMGGVEAHARRLGAALAFPYDYRLRWPDPSPKRTSVHTSRTFMEIVAPATAFSSPLVPDFGTSDVFIALLGLPGLCYAVNVGNTSFRPAAAGNLSAYQMLFLEETGTGNLGSIWAPDDPVRLSHYNWVAGQSRLEVAAFNSLYPIFGTLRSVTKEAAVAGGASVGNISAPHGSNMTMVQGTQGEQIRYFFMNAGDSLMLYLKIGAKMNSTNTGLVRLFLSIRITELTPVNELDDTVLTPFSAAASAMPAGAELLQYTNWNFVAPTTGWYGWNISSGALALSAVGDAGAGLILTTFQVEMKVLCAGSSTTVQASTATTPRQWFDFVLTPTASNISSFWQLQSNIITDPSSGGDRALGKSLRVNAASILVTNVTPALTAGGSLTGYRVRSTVNDLRSSFWNTDRAALERTSTKSTWAAAKGAYSFVLHESDYAMYYDQTTHGNPALGPFVSGDRLTDSYTHFLAISPPSTGGNTFRITYDEAVESASDSFLYAHGVTNFRTADREELYKMVIRRKEWWYENPSHVEAIYNWLRGAGKRMISYAKQAAPVAVPAITALNPQWGALLGAAAGLM